MPEQGELWPTEQSKTSRWEMIPQPEQAALIAVLIRLLINTVHPKPLQQNGGDNDER